MPGPASGARRDTRRLSRASKSCYSQVSDVVDADPAPTRRMRVPSSARCHPCKALGAVVHRAPKGTRTPRSPFVLRLSMTPFLSCLCFERKDTASVSFDWKRLDAEKKQVMRPTPCFDIDSFHGEFTARRRREHRHRSCIHAALFNRPGRADCVGVRQSGRRPPSPSA